MGAAGDLLTRKYTTVKTTAAAMVMSSHIDHRLPTLGYLAHNDHANPNH